MLWFEKVWFFPEENLLIEFLLKNITSWHFASKKDVYSIYALNLHLQIWKQHEPTIYNNLQYHNLHVLVDTQPSKRFQTHHTKTFVAALNHMNTVSEEYFFNYKNHISMKSFTQRANQWLRKKWRIRSYSGPHFSRIFSHSEWIRRDTEYLSVFSPNARTCGNNANKNHSEYGLFLSSEWAKWHLLLYWTITKFTYIKHENNTNITVVGYVDASVGEITNQKVKFVMKKKRTDIKFNRKSDSASP